MQPGATHIIDFKPELSIHFKNLNIAWLQKYFYVEPIDEEMLSHPKQHIIDKGGQIFFAEVAGEIAGTFALMKVNDDEYELCKMAVHEKFQGRKIGNKLLEFAIKRTKELGASKLILFSNTILEPAIHLYRKYGFVEVPLESSEYKRSNIKMEKDLTPGPSPAKLERGAESSVEESYPKYDVRDSIQFENARKNRRNNTEAEAKLWEQLRSSRLGYKFRRQHPVESYVVDFVCLEKGLIVEVDGGYHNSQEQKEYDAYRTQILQQKGFIVVRFRNEEITENVYTVRNKIKQMLSNLDTTNSISKEGTTSAENISPLSSSAGEGPGVRSRLQQLFLHKNNRVLNVYCTAGYPKLDSTLEVMKALQEGGVDLIELGIPYSDPLADGPVIQASGSKAIQNGMTVKVLFEQLKDFRKQIHVPVILMGYINQVIQYGFEKFCADAERVGVDGLIFPDLPIYEFENIYGAIIRKHNLDFIFLVTPETSEERIKKLDSLSSGFLYAVSSSSTTGKDKNIADQEAYFKKLKSLNLKNPVLVGFGIKDKQTFEAACSYANGAIIGSAYIKALEAAEDVSKATKEFLESILL